MTQIQRVRLLYFGVLVVYPFQASRLKCRSLRLKSNNHNWLIYNYLPSKDHRRAFIRGNYLLKQEVQQDIAGYCMANYAAKTHQPSQELLAPFILMDNY